MLTQDLWLEASFRQFEHRAQHVYLSSLVLVWHPNKVWLLARSKRPGWIFGEMLARFHGCGPTFTTLNRGTAERLLKWASSCCIRPIAHVLHMVHGCQSRLSQHYSSARCDMESAYTLEECEEIASRKLDSSMKVSILRRVFRTSLAERAEDEQLLCNALQLLL